MSHLVHAFTAESKSLSKVLVSPVFISQAHNPHVPTKKPEQYQFWAIWDTGATGTVISKTVVEKCGLLPVDMVYVNTAGGLCKSNVYIINIILPNNVCFRGIRVTEGAMGDEFDALIGMDIINTGDFAISNKDGKTVFTFRVPSIERTDYARHAPKEKPFEYNQKKIGRNDPCPCGSGKKYKKCCGSPSHKSRPQPTLPI